MQIFQAISIEFCRQYRPLYKHGLVSNLVSVKYLKRTELNTVDYVTTILEKKNQLLKIIFQIFADILKFSDEAG